MTAALTFLGILASIAAFTYVAATLYYRYKNAQWFASWEGADATSPTEDEKAIGDEWIKPDVAPEHSNPPPGYAPCTREAPHAGACAHPEIIKEDKVVVSDEALEELIEEVSPQPASMADLSVHRIPLPKAKDMVGVMYQKSVEHQEAFSASGIIGVDDSERCLMCVEQIDHFHTGADVKVYIEREARMSFEKHVADMDLTQLSQDALEKFHIRVRSRLEWMASLDGMKKLDALYDNAQQLLREQIEDEAFYQQTLADEKAKQAAEVKKAAVEYYPPGSLKPMEVRDAIIDEMKNDMSKKFGHQPKDYVFNGDPLPLPPQGTLAALLVQSKAKARKSKRALKKAMTKKYGKPKAKPRKR